MCFNFSYTVQVDIIYQKVLWNSRLFFLRHEIQKNKRTYFAKVRLHCVLLKKNFCVINKIKQVRFYIFYRNYFFWVVKHVRFH